MPRYFFHTAEGDRDRDHVGTDLIDADAARREAIRFAGAVMRDQPDILWRGRDFRVEVTDVDEQLLFTVVTLAMDAPQTA